MKKLTCRGSSSPLTSQPRRCAEACPWRPRLIALAFTAGLGLSTVSSLDCHLVDFGDGGSGIGLWSLSGPNGRCLSYQDAREYRAPSTPPLGTGADDFIVADGVGITTKEDAGTNNYSMWLVNGDISWSLCRIMAILGAAFGLFATVSDDEEDLEMSALVELSAGSHFSHPVIFWLPPHIVDDMVELIMSPIGAETP